jgi:hypothetical protein
VPLNLLRLYLAMMPHLRRVTIGQLVGYGSWLSAAMALSDEERNSL